MPYATDFPKAPKTTNHLVNFDVVDYDESDGLTAPRAKKVAQQDRSEAKKNFRSARGNQKSLKAKALKINPSFATAPREIDRSPYEDSRERAHNMHYELESIRSSSSAQSRETRGQGLNTEVRLGGKEVARARGAILPAPHPKSLASKAKFSLKAKRDAWRAKAASGTAPRTVETDLHASDRMNRTWNKVKAIEPGELPDLD